ncbi:MAG: gliding motility protein RemB [Aureibaculum sp.]|nr:gliding motility protein RemB [Aureibaculum sp.]
MKKFILGSLLLLSNICIAQVDIYPVYEGCEASNEITLESCFNQNVTKDVIANFTIPEKVKADDYRGTINVVFLVTKEGKFEVLYVRSAYKELEDEVKKVFTQLKTVKPATYNGRTIEMRFGMPISIPLDSQIIPQTIEKQNNYNEIVDPTNNANLTVKNDIQSAIVSTRFPEHNSELNIPFTYQTYNEMSYYYDKSDNSHTGFKPYQYSEATKYIDLDAQKTALLKDKKSWGGRKFWNEHLFKVQEKDYWFTVNPIFDLQIGKDNSDNIDFTYNNTRAIQIQGGLGKKLNFSTSFYESQGRFSGYVNDFIRTNIPLGASGTVPGRGKGKGLDKGGFDYPVAEAYLSYSPNKFFNFQFGHGKNFIGDGYRSMMLSDVASPYPHFKISTNFWKIKYTNLWMWLDDVRPELSVNDLSPRKYAAIHHLSWNVNKKLNIGLFEAIITDNENGRGFDVNFFNPVIFYRAIEFSRGSEAGNALMGFSTKYKWSQKFSTYTQFVLDELTVGKFFDGTKYWGNKFSVQLGAKYYNAFDVDNLYFQGELNVSRPYTYSNRKSILNYGHFNQPLGHLWGSNFWEAIGIASYKKDRWFGNAKLTIGKKGFDKDGLNYGGNIYSDNDDRIGDTGIELLQGNKTSIFIADLQAGYVVNPATNLQFFGGLTFRNFDPTTETTNFSKQNTTWFTIGLRTDVFNWYFDF